MTRFPVMLSFPFGLDEASCFGRWTYPDLVSFFKIPLISTINQGVGQCHPPKHIYPTAATIVRMPHAVYVASNPKHRLFRVPLSKAGPPPCRAYHSTPCTAQPSCGSSGVILYAGFPPGGGFRSGVFNGVLGFTSPPSQTMVSIRAVCVNHLFTWRSWWEGIGS